MAGGRRPDQKASLRWTAGQGGASCSRMNHMECTPALEVGFAKIDEDHRELIAALNELHAAMEQGKDKTELAKVQFPPGLHGQPLQDGRGADDPVRLPGRPGPVALTEALLDFLETWLVGHILGQDHELGVYLRARGVAA